MAVGKQFRLGSKVLLHFGRRTEMILSPQALLGMLLTQQRQRADALHDVVFPTVRGLFVMNRRGSYARQGTRALAKGIQAVDFQVKTIRKILRQLSHRTDRQEAVSGIKEGLWSRLPACRCLGF